MINSYEKLLSEYFITVNKKRGWNILSNMLNTLIWLVLIGHMHHFRGVVREYRCWGPTRWASRLFVPPRVLPPVCLRSFLPLFATLSMPGLFQSSAVQHAEYPSKSVKERALPSQSYLDELHLDWEDKLNWLQQASCLAPGCVMDFSRWGCAVLIRTNIVSF